MLRLKTLYETPSARSGVRGERIEYLQPPQSLLSTSQECSDSSIAMASLKVRLWNCTEWLVFCTRCDQLCSEARDTNQSSRSDPTIHSAEQVHILHPVTWMGSRRGANLAGCGSFAAMCASGYNCFARSDNSPIFFADDRVHLFTSYEVRSLISVLHDDLVEKKDRLEFSDS